MHFIDFFRFVVFAEAGMALAFMVGTNIMTWRVLRPPRKRGFLWWHVLTICLGVICISIIALERVAGHLGSPPTWRTWVTLSGMTLILAAQWIIYHVEHARLVYRKAIDKSGSESLERALVELRTQDDG